MTALRSQPLSNQSQIGKLILTIGFETGNNEAPQARQTAEYLGTNHHEYICTPAQALNIVLDLPTIYDEPFADSSAIPTILVSRFAQKKVTVAVGRRGDEICGLSQL